MSNNQRNAWSRGNPPPNYTNYQYNGSEPTAHSHQPILTSANYQPIQPGPPPSLQDRQALPSISQNFNSQHVTTIQPLQPQERPLRPSIHQPILAQNNQGNQKAPPEANEIISPIAQSPGYSPSPSNGVRPLNVRDALSYLDRVKMEFQNRPEIYNRFLDIMKDFKSQSIDTPGVIDRVSGLFRGYPTLIIGFNTFLPPGFRIEMSSDPNDPNGVRVIVPDNVAPIHLNEPDRYGPQTFGPPNSHPAYQLPPPFEQGPQNSLPPHHLPLSNIYPRGEIESSGLPPHSHQPNSSLSRRKPPLEFNHAINYVNRIKNRFSREPDSFKQFLEILQMYRRDHRPITEIYARVQTLFGNDADLLDEFCQFLPDPAAALDSSHPLIRIQPSIYSNQPPPPPHDINLPPIGSSSGRTYQSHHPSHSTHQGHPSSSKHSGRFHSGSEIASAQYGSQLSAHDPYTPRMPIVGTSKIENSVMGPAVASPSLMSGSKKKRSLFGVDRLGSQSKPKKLKAGASKLKGEEFEDSQVEQQEAYEVEFARQNSQIAFPEIFEKFEIIKRHINHLPTYHEFLKVLNLHSQDILDTHSLVTSIEAFIGNDEQLFSWFKKCIGYIPRPGSLGAPKPRVDLTRCRPVGTSYRLLPSSEKKIICSGRDELCNEVLNDTFASHSLWASEEISFAAPKKTPHEMILNKSEEDRFELDFNLETNSHAIALLEPLADKISDMSPEQQASWQLPPGLGGTSITIYKRAVYKLYDAEAAEVFELLHSSPAKAIPVVLRRLRQKNLEWCEQKKEFLKLWRELDVKNYYRSLDYQTSLFKSNERKTLTPRYLTTEIEAIKREQPNGKLGNPHFNFTMPDLALHKDMLRLIKCNLNSNPNLTPTERNRAVNFFCDFIKDFFGLGNSEPKSQETQDYIVLGSDIPISFRHPAKRLMFCNQHIYAILRLYQILYARVSFIKEKSSQANLCIKAMAKKRSAAGKKVPLPNLEALNGVDPSTIDCYPEFLKITEGLIESRMEQLLYEDTVRGLFGNKVYCVFTLDKILNGICKQASLILAELNKPSLELIQHFRSTLPNAVTIASLAEYRKNVLTSISDDENVYLVEYSSPTKSLAFQLFEGHELSLEYFQSLAQTWSAYCASYSADAPTAGVTPQRRVFLKRCLKGPNDMCFNFNGLRPSVCPSTFRLKWPHSFQQTGFFRPNSLLTNSKPDFKRSPRKERWNWFSSRWSRGLAKPAKTESHCRRWLEGRSMGTLIRDEKPHQVPQDLVEPSS